MGSILLSHRGELSFTCTVHTLHLLHSPYLFHSIVIVSCAPTLAAMQLLVFAALARMLFSLQIRTIPKRNLPCERVGLMVRGLRRVVAPSSRPAVAQVRLYKMAMSIGSQMGLAAGDDGRDDANAIGQPTCGSPCHGSGARTSLNPFLDMPQQFPFDFLFLFPFYKL